MPDRVSGDSIAVVIPVYNGTRYLAEALRSVLAQTRLPDQIFVVDDGSTDDSVSVARSFPSVTVLTQANAGVSVSRNRGVKAATNATWIAFLDHDDLWEKENLEHQLAALHATAGADVCVVGRRNLVHREDGESEPEPPILPPPAHRIPGLLSTSLRIQPSCLVVRRSLFLEVGGFEAGVHMAEDWDLWLRLAEAGAVFVTCPEPLVRYRIHAANVSHNGRRMYDSEMRVFERRIAPRIGNPLRRALARRQAQGRFLPAWHSLNVSRTGPSTDYAGITGCLADRRLAAPQGACPYARIAPWLGTEMLG